MSLISNNSSAKVLSAPLQKTFFAQLKASTTAVSLQAVFDETLKKACPLASSLSEGFVLKPRKLVLSSPLKGTPSGVTTTFEATFFNQVGGPRARASAALSGLLLLSCLVEELGGDVHYTDIGEKSVKAALTLPAKAIPGIAKLLKRQQTLQTNQLKKRAERRAKVAEQWESDPFLAELKKQAGELDLQMAALNKQRQELHQRIAHLNEQLVVEAESLSERKLQAEIDSLTELLTA